MSLTRVSALVSATWLKQQITLRSHQRLKLLDASWTALRSGKDDYLSAHIPGATFFDLNYCVQATPTLPRNLPDPECFTEYSQSLGVDRQSHLVVYDRGGMLSAARTWWTFRAFGHESISVLNGGLNQWQAEDFETVSGEEQANKKGDFEARLTDALVTDFETMKSFVGTNKTQIVDCRRPEHYLGLEQEPTSFTEKALQGMNLPQPSSMSRGHIPGAVNILEDLALNPDSKCLLSQAELLKLFAEKGIDLSLPLVTMCYNGHAAALMALAAYTCGKHDTSVYFGSWTEWGQKASKNLVVAPQPSQATGA